MSGSGSFGDMGNLLKQAQQMHAEMNRAREELRSLVVSGTSGGGIPCGRRRRDGVFC